MDFLIGGLAGAGATVFSNPMDVVKTRMQLQGELRARAHAQRHYGGILHAMYVIAKTDGIFALQKGLVPATLLGFTMNSVRLGLYHVAESRQWTKTKDGDFSLPKAMFWSSLSGVLSGITGNPASVLKTRMQSDSHPSIAVGKQHKYTGILDGCVQIYKADGIRGFFAGVNATCLRIGIGSAAQLSSYTATKTAFKSRGIDFNSPFLLSLASSAVSGVATALAACPLDVCSVRLYNQGSGPVGKRKYKGLWDCFYKTYKTEGLHGLYKGVGPFYFRIAPHTTISLVIWDMLNDIFIPDKPKSKTYFAFFLFYPKMNEEQQKKLITNRTIIQKLYFYAFAMGGEKCISQSISMELQLELMSSSPEQQEQLSESSISSSSQLQSGKFGLKGRRPIACL